MFGHSFRARLTSFFIVIVILPMVAVSVVVFRLVADSQRGKSDARLAQAQTTAESLFREQEQRAAAAGRAIGRSQGLAEAIESGDASAIARELNRLRRARGVAGVRLELPGQGTFRGGRRTGIAESSVTLVDRQGRDAGTLEVAAVTPAQFAREVRAVTGLQAAVVAPDATASTLEGIDVESLPERGEIEAGGDGYRLTSFTAPDGQGRISVRLLANQRDTQADITTDSLVVAAMLLAFLVLAFAFALIVSRSLQAQIQRLLVAARRLGSGELTVKVPTEGNDEFAALGTEFNLMARQLEGRLDELEAERERLQQAIRRVGESFAKGLDREALLDIVVETAVDGVAAEAGRIRVREVAGGALEARSHVGDADGFAAVLDAAEAAVMDSGEPAEVSLSDLHALAHPLGASDGARPQGVIALARNSRAFSAAEHDLFNYLARQAAVSIENVDLHEAVQRQAVTDELTGLFNHRRFQEVMTAEVERAKRYDHSLGLVMLDIDDFKRINDRYGHLQGDEVLREVARVLLDSSREIDEPARYGGEEMAVALPQTDLEGAVLFGERVRQRIEALEIPMVDGGPGAVRVTASVGAAALPESAVADKDALVAAADSALYRAKRLGKNRVVKAG